MGILTDDMKRVVREQRLGYIATVCPDGTPNLSPKATMRVWDDDHLIFADIASPGTMANLRQNPAIEINMVDVFLRKGYRFKGAASILEPGDQFDDAMRLYTGGANGAQSNVASPDPPVRAGESDAGAAGGVSRLRGRRYRRRDEGAVEAVLRFAGTGTE